MRERGEEDGRVRVLFVSDHLGVPGGAADGATTYFLNTLPSLAASDIDLTVCFLRGRHPVAVQLEASGVFPVFLGRHKWDPLAVVDLVRIIREREIQVVHAAGMKTILLGRWAAKLEGCRSIVHLHDLNDPGPLIRMLHRRMSGWTDLALGISRAVAEQAVTDFGIAAERVKVLHNGIPVERFAFSSPARERIRAELGFSPSSKVVGVIARLVPEKGHDVLLRAVRRVRDEVPEATFLLVGEGPSRAVCERLIEALGISGDVRLTGFRDDVAEILSGVDLVAIPSLAEGLGFSALEAMAAGRPVVATDTGGLPEIIEDGTNGLLVKPGDEVALAEGIVRVLKDERLAERIADEGRARARDFGVEQHLDILLTEYRRLGAPGKAVRRAGPRPLAVPEPAGRQETA